MANSSYSAGNLEMRIQAVGNNATASLSSVNKELKTMLSLLGSSSSLFKSMNTKVKLPKITDSLGLSNGSGKKALSFATILGKLYFIRNYTKQIGRGIANLVQNGINYTETLNLWQVAMRENRYEAEEFIDTMNKAYGISEKTLMNYQATFKNMLSALGGISEGTSYALSEYLTQMALDYASLYNTSIQRAMTVFQSVLSGQVRPIRSISGYDITETTIFQLYQQLGGTKTMRQLSQTEKRLLRIYAVFQQMQTSGTIGDLNKTLNNSANQLRILSESLEELGTWLGIIMEQWIRPILPYLNAIVITTKNIIQAMAIMSGYEPFEGAIESVEEYNEELDKATGKLLSFDKFESLNTGGQQDSGLLGIDSALLAGLAQYNSLLESVKNKATELAEKWTDWWVDSDTGELTRKAEELVDVLKAVGISLAVLIGFRLVTKIGNIIGKITGLTTAVKLLEFGLVTGIIYTFMKAIEYFKEGDYMMGTLALTIGVTLVGALILLEIRKKAVARATMYETMAQASHNQSLKEYNILMAKTNKMISTKLLASMGSLAVGVIAAVGAFFLFNSLLNSLDGTAKKTVAIIGIVVGALSVLLGVILAIKGGMKGGLVGAAVAGLGVGLVLAGIKGVASKNSDLSDLQVRKNGGLVEDGLFTMNKKEMFGQFDDGTSVVANNMQITQGIENASYRGYVRAMRETGKSQGVGNVYLNGKKVGYTTAQSSHKEMVRAGLIKANA